MTIKGRYLGCFAICLFLISCGTAIDEKTIEQFVPDPKVYVNANLRGIVLDEAGLAVSGAQVKIENEETITDETGYFLFESANLISKGAIVRITKSGYFNGSRYILPSFKDNFVQFNLIPKVLVGTFSALIRDTIILNDGAKIIFPPSVLQDRNENSYEGLVKVYAHWLNPIDDDLGTLMPANLVGINLQEQQVALASLGMMNIELLSSTDEALSIKGNATVRLHFPLPEELQTSAPPILPLWSLNPDNNVWKQDGQANLVNNTLEAEVSHFDWWNCAWPYNSVSFNGHILFENDSVPVKDEKISISLVGKDWQSTAIFTNENGFFNTIVPAQSRIRIELINNENEIFYSDEIGPFSEDHDIGDIFL